MTFSKVISTDYVRTVTVQALEGRYLELAMVHICSRLDWTSQLERETEVRCTTWLGRMCLSAYLQD